MSISFCRRACHPFPVNFGGAGAQSHQTGAGARVGLRRSAQLASMAPDQPNLVMHRVDGTNAVSAST
jgi:hypothetical protein